MISTVFLNSGRDKEFLKGREEAEGSKGVCLRLRRVRVPDLGVRGKFFRFRRAR